MKKLINKKPKPATLAQKATRERNWNKRQILCIRSIARNVANSKTTNQKERILLDAMIINLNTILQHWK